MGAALGYDKIALGHIGAVSAMAYGIGKFLMGYLSDRSNPRKFITVGLLLTAGLNFAFGAIHNYSLPNSPSGRSTALSRAWVMALRARPGDKYTYKGARHHFWPLEHRSQSLVAARSASSAPHGAPPTLGWESAFYVPGAIACLAAIYLFWRMRDTPKSLGLPPIEEFKKRISA